MAWAAIFLIAALMAIAFGLGGAAGTVAGLSQFLFLVFILLFVLALLARAFRDH